MLILLKSEFLLDLMSPDLNLYILSFCLYCLLKEHFERLSFKDKAVKGIQQRLSMLFAGLCRNYFNFLHLRKNQPKS